MEEKQNNFARLMGVPDCYLNIGDFIKDEVLKSKIFEVFCYIQAMEEYQEQLTRNDISKAIAMKKRTLALLKEGLKCQQP